MIVPLRPTQKGIEHKLGWQRMLSDADKAELTRLIADTAQDDLTVRSNAPGVTASISHEKARAILDAVLRRLDEMR